ncbi:MAG: S-layer homology domain-containing protein [Oscillospiraceae bacterium]|nr:S-layer homology domain-containing protein [Oscillospiraceae bacterium]
MKLPAGSNPSNYYVSFSNYSSYVGSLYDTSNNYYTSYKLTDLDNVYLSIDTYGTWSANYVITYGSSQTLTSGTLAIVVESYSVVPDTIYTATAGESVSLDIQDFYDFWNTYTDGYGSLNYVRISSVTGLSGTLCYDHSTSESRHNSASGSSFYVHPTTSQKDLSKLTFIPSKNGSKYPTGTVTISFTASGTNRSNYTTSASGKIQITYTQSEVTPIVYTSSNNYITLNGSDFDRIYKAATGSTSSNPSYTIQFLDLPKYGTLYRNYTGTNLGSLYNYELTEQNISSLTFSNRSSNTNSIGKVVYVPSNFTSLNDTVRYAAYSGNTLLYWGSIQFNTEEIVIKYECSSATMKFSASDFFTSSTSMLNAQYVAFGAPSSGTLYKDYENGTGTTVLSTEYFSYSDNFGVSNLNRITYVPTTGFSGTVEIPFFSTTLSGLSINGKIQITVTAPPAPSFTDVNSSKWYASYVNRLSTAGIIKGTSATTFSPNANMKYGEALTMILLAAGYPQQIESGSHWASNYLTLAYNSGIVSTTNIDLDAAVDRDTIATIAAKAMGLSYASSVKAGISAPSDSTNGYVYALYNAGIVGGQFDYKGTNYFYGNRNITRAEVSKIICNIMDYNK